MNILYIIDSDTVSGTEVVLLHYLEYFKPPRHSVHVFLRDTTTCLQSALIERGLTFTATSTFSERLIETSLSPRAWITYSRAFYRTRRELLDVIGDRRIDLMHSISYPASLYAAFAARSSKRFQVWHEHNIKRLHMWNRPIYRFVASTSIKVVGPSNAVTDNLAASGIEPSRLETIYHGVDLRRFRIDDSRAAIVRRDLGLRDAQPAVGLFGQMLPYKGHVTLIAAGARLRQRFPDLRCFFVGALENPPYQAELAEALERGGVADMFTFTGWRADVADVMRAMDIIVVGTVTPEPAALALMESMAVGRPVVATRTGGTPEIVLDGATRLIVKPGDAGDLADKLEGLLADANERRRLGKNGRQRVEDHFSLERHLQEMAQMYESAMPERRSP